MFNFLKFLPAVLFLTGFVSVSHAVTNWIVWDGAPSSESYTSSSTDGVFDFNYATTATGYIVNPHTSETIQVTFNGEITQWSQFNNPYGTDVFANESTYLGPTVDTLPPAGNFIAITGYSGMVNTLTFSKPIKDLVMAIGSLGGNAGPASYVFNRTPTVVSHGPGHWNNGSVPDELEPLQVNSGNPDQVDGKEANGVVQFFGTFSSLTWSIPNSEVYSVFNVGISNVPEPSAFSLLLVGLGGLAVMRRRRA